MVFNSEVRLLADKEGTWRLWFSLHVVSNSRRDPLYLGIWGA